MLRQNRITKIDPVPWLAQLEELDLYDNGLTVIENLGACSSGLQVLDLSFNRIAKISGIDGLQALHTLYLISNGIVKIEGLPRSLALKYLELGANKIQAIEGLEAVPSLEQLFFGQNRISSFIGLGCLKNLRVLSLQSNRLVDWTGIEELPESLEELYLSHNRLQELPHLNLPKLRILDVGSNRISRIPKGFGSTLPSLVEFWASDNLLDNLNEQLDQFDAGLKTRLTTVYLGGTNPLAAHPRYVAVVRQEMPALKQIDATILSWS